MISYSLRADQGNYTDAANSNSRDGVCGDKQFQLEVGSRCDIRLDGSGLYKYFKQIQLYASVCT